MSKEQKNNEQHQQWQPHWILRALHRIWQAAFSVIKVALGAVATVVVILTVCLLVFAGLLADYLEQDVIPNAGVTLNQPLSLTSDVLYVDSNGKIQTLQTIESTEARKWASFEDIPQALIDATVAIEDKRFYEHQGVDWLTTIKACAGMFFSDSNAGGSTITQQLVKNLTEENDITVQRKVKEWFNAAAVEKQYTKDEIMENYLNIIYLGENAYGVRRAAAVYFGKELEALTPAECASLIGITNNPSIYDPYASAFVFGPDQVVMTGAERNQLRQRTILAEMYSQGYLTDEEYQEALDQELVYKDGIDAEDRMTTCDNKECGFKDIGRNFTLGEDGEYYCPECGQKVELAKNLSKGVYSWFVDTVLEDVIQALMDQDGVEWNDSTRATYLEKIQTGGYHIFSTYDEEVQNQIDKIYEDLDQIPETRSGQQLESAIVVVDNRTGYIVGMAGGVGEKTVHDAFNRATEARRSNGSSIKPLTVYGPAFELGIINPTTVIKDLPLYYDANGPFPRNDDRRYYYSRTIFKGITSSVNAVAVNVLDSIGVGYSYEFAKEKLRLHGLVSSDMDYAPLALGAEAYGVTVRDMTSAFATFANDGEWREGLTFTKVYDSDGNLVLDNTQESEQVFSEKTVNYMNYCLTNAVQSGTGTAANIYSQYVAGKTGSSGSNQDRWFCGYTDYYTAAVWCGYEYAEEIILVGNTANPAARLWKKVMEPLHNGLPAVRLYSTSGMVSVNMCRDSGKVATEACYADFRIGVDGFHRVEDGILVYADEAPKEKCDKHVMVDFCDEGKAAANEYCKLFAEAQGTKLSEKSLVKMTQEEIDELLKAEKYRLEPEYLMDAYVYLVDKNGKDGVWTGFHNDYKDNKAPYITCTVHTKEAWEAYQKEHGTTDPENPTDPEDGSATFPKFPWIGW